MVATIDVMVTSNGVMVTTIGGRLGRSSSLPGTSSAGALLAESHRNTHKKWA
jgi:hypothetical protein